MSTYNITDNIGSMMTYDIIISIDFMSIYNTTDKRLN